MRSVTVSDNTLHFYPTPQTAWEAMYDDCAAATESINIEQYIFNDDDTGRRFLRLFAKKAEEGVSVRLLLDGIGSRSVSGSPLVADLLNKGGLVHFYNRPHWRGLPLPFRWLPRNHAKVMTVDSDIGYVGGVCLAHHMGGWRDLHVRVSGGLIADMKRDFMRFWTHLVKHKRGYKTLRFVPSRTIQYLTKHPAFRVNPLYRSLLRQIRKASSRIYIASPFFVPPRGLRRALYKAVKRGVKVTVLASHTSDTALVDLVTRSYLPGLLRKGIDVRLFKPTVFHAKYMLIDDTWAAVGSTNIDHLSIIQNREASLILTDQASVAVLAKNFDADLKDSRKATRADWLKLPLHKRLIGRLGRVFRRVL